MKQVSPFSVSRRQLLAALPAMGVASLPVRAVAAPMLSVVATTGMIADAVSNVGGDLVDVQALMGPGVDPHSYRQTRSDIVALSRADLVFWNGLYLEAQLEELLLDLDQVTSVEAVAEAVPQDRLIGHDDYEGRYDPHVWMDPRLWTFAIHAIEDALVRARPDEATRLAEAAHAYASQATELAVYSVEALTSVPQASRVLVTAHDAFNYFGRAYGFEVVGIQGLSTESEAGLNHIAELVDLLVDRGIGAVFVESSVSDRNIRALIEGARSRGHEVVIGGELYSDAMGMPGTYEGTWLGMIDHNVTTIARALGGKAPEAGRLGRLA